MLNNNILSIELLDYTINKKDIINGVTFNVSKGELISIIGPNGSGKSTLIKLVSGEILPSKGKVVFKNKDIKNWDLMELANHRSVLPQSSQLTFPFSVLNIVKMGRYPLEMKGKNKMQDDDYMEILNEFDLLDNVEQQYTTLSGGEKQRVHLARIFAQIWGEDDYSEKLLLLDEPTSYLDIRHQHSLFEFLQKMNKKGLTVIMVLHDLNHAFLNSQKLIMLKDSRLMSICNSEDVDEEILRKVFDIKVKLINDKSMSKPIIVSTN